MRLLPKCLTILHLSLVFIYISWVGLFPFLGEYFNTKAQLTTVMSVMGHEGLSHELGGLNKLETEKLQRQKILFQKIPLDQQERLIQKLNEIHTKDPLSITEKISKGMTTLVYGVPLFLQIWLSFSFLICIFLLLKIDGAIPSALLLPVIATVFSFYNYFHGLDPLPHPASKLFPDEKELVETYMDKPLDDRILEQQKQLFDAWKKYLVVNWINESPSSDTHLFEVQVERAEHSFMIVRLFKEWDARDAKSSLYSDLHQRQALSLLLMFICWNVLFAWQVRRKNTYIN
ncbi:MAG: hypothetical protein ACI9S8_002422 [Chlamydiales bacterium]|jgi:hypothetical protein